MKNVLKRKKKIWNRLTPQFACTQSSSVSFIHHYYSTLTYHHQNLKVSSNWTWRSEIIPSTTTGYWLFVPSSPLILLTRLFLTCWLSCHPPNIYQFLPSSDAPSLLNTRFRSSSITLSPTLFPLSPSFPLSLCKINIQQSRYYLAILQTTTCPPLSVRCLPTCTILASQPSHQAVVHNQLGRDSQRSRWSPWLSPRSSECLPASCELWRSLQLEHPLWLSI